MGEGHDLSSARQIDDDRVNRLVVVERLRDEVEEVGRCHASIACGGYVKFSWLAAFRSPRIAVDEAGCSR